LSCWNCMLFIVDVCGDAKSLFGIYLKGSGMRNNC
jgi:hypothetical protein